MKVSTKEKVYLKLPPVIQNILVTIAGIVERKRRYSGCHDSMLSEILKFEELEIDEKKKHIDMEVRRILNDAVSNVPYYRNLALGDDITKYPVLRKETIRTSCLELISDNADKDKLLKINTGGSSGTPLQVNLNIECRQKSYAFWSDFYTKMGVSNRSRKLSLVGRKVCNPSSKKPPFWRYALATKQMLLSNFHIAEEFIPDIVSEINKFNPEVIEGYAQSVVNLARMIEKTGTKLKISPKCISVSSESFSSEDRRVMEQVFGCKVYNQYGSAETVVFGYECPEGAMHLNELYGKVEVRDDKGYITDLGTGDLIVTGLLNNAQPLVRYEIGDTGKISNIECKCGISSKCIEEFSGRIGDSLIVGTRKIPAAAVSLFFKYSPEVDRAQVFSYKGKKIVVNATSTKGSIDFGPIIDEARKSISDQIDIEFNQVPEISPESNGKYKLVKNV